jgi:hypothetical protein
LLEAGGEIEYKMSSHFATHLRWSQSGGFSNALIDQFRYEQQNQAYLAEIISKARVLASPLAYVFTSGEG